MTTDACERQTRSPAHTQAFLPSPCIQAAGQGQFDRVPQCMDLSARQPLENLPCVTVGGQEPGKSTAENLGRVVGFDHLHLKRDITIVSGVQESETFGLKGDVGQHR